MRQPRINTMWIHWAGEILLDIRDETGCFRGSSCRLIPTNFLSLSPMGTILQIKNGRNEALILVRSSSVRFGLEFASNDQESSFMFLSVTRSMCHSGDIPKFPSRANSTHTIVVRLLLRKLSKASNYSSPVRLSSFFEKKNVIDHAWRKRLQTQRRLRGRSPCTITACLR